VFVTIFVRGGFYLAPAFQRCIGIDYSGASIGVMFLQCMKGGGGMGLSEEMRREKARLALPILVHIAMQGRTITYGELGKAIGVVAVSVGNVCGYIRDILTEPRGIPPINCIVVSKSSGCPTEICSGDTAEEAALKFPEYRNRVYSYSGWNALLKDLGISSL
jgi:hypothetical protein